jgi:hypothetical protein
MKTLKKLFLILAMLAISYVGFSQSPVDQIRVPDRTTAVGQNLPAGTTIICLSDSTYWNVRAVGMASTLTLTTGRGSVNQTGAATDISMKKDKSDSTATDGYVRRDRLTSSLATKLNKNTAIIGATKTKITYDTNGLVTGGADLSSGDIPNNAASTTGSAASFTGNLAGDVTGTQGATVVGKINGISMAGLTTGILKNTTGTGAPSIAIASDFPTLNQNTTGTSANVTGTVVVANGGTGLNTITSGSYMVGAGTGAVALKTPAQVLTDIGGIASTNAGLPFVEPTYEETTTGASGIIKTLTHTPKSTTSIQVLYNGTPLNSSDYTYTSATPSIQVIKPVYKYDKITVSYGY